MKKQPKLILLLALTFALWGPASAQVDAEIDLEDVVIIEDIEPEAEMPVPEPMADVVDTSAEPTPAELEAPEPSKDVVLEAPGAEVAEANMDTDVPVAPEAEVVPAEPEMEDASIDVEEPVIPEAAAALPDETEIVLEIPGQETEGTGEATMASEETISVDFPDEDVRTILRNVADLFDLNLVIPDTLQGRTSVKLRNITWRQVFEVVLDPFGFTYVEDRNIILIKSIEELTTEPVDTRVFIANYSRAEELQGSIAPLVDAAAGGQIRVDSRSNALVITERPSRMNKIQEIIERLDRPTAQVMVETKFVEVTDSDIKNIGVNWASLSGYGVSAGPFQRDWGRTRTRSDADTFVLTDDDGFSSDDGVSFEDATTLTEDLSRLASTTRTDSAVFSAETFSVVLSALEELRDVELVSNPTVVVLNNEEAYFQVGQDYPIREFEFNPETGQIEPGDLEKEELGITLRVTPSANAAGMINLDVEPRVTTLVGTIQTIAGLEDPLIEVKTTKTKVTIKDGFTLALGGLTERTNTSNSNQVPVLGKLPGVGRLFNSTSDNLDLRNLIIFITAKTLNPDGSTYEDIVDPRMLDEMGIVPSELPGYTVTEEERELLDLLKAYRIEAKLAESTGKTAAEIRAIERAKQREEEEKNKAPNERR
ncbi:MAG: secretin N-terminal domain-containing protein [Verrucomicrobiota bacterium]